MICNSCKKYFTDGNRPGGMPNGVAFVLQGGKRITVCADCMISLGKMDDDHKREFLDTLMRKKMQ